VENAELGIGSVPVGRDLIEDEAEVGVGAGGEGRGGDGFGIDIGLAAADEVEGEGFVLGDFLVEVVKEDLYGDGGDGAVAEVGDGAVDVGDLAAGEVCRLAHDDVGEGEGGGVGVEVCVDLGDGGGFVVAAEEQKTGEDDKDDGGSDGEGEPISFRSWVVGSNAGLGLRFLAHRGDFTPNL